MKAVSVSRSATPWNSASSPIGSSSGATPAPKRSRSWSSVRSNDGPLAVELVDEDHAGAGRARRPPSRAGSVCTSTPVDRADDEHGQVGDAQGGQGLALEVGVARRVDQVDAVALPLERRDAPARATGRGAAPRARCRRRSCRPRPARAADDGAGLEQQGLGQRRLAGRRRGRPGPRCGSFRSGPLPRAHPLVSAAACSLLGPSSVGPRRARRPVGRPPCVPIADGTGLPLPGHRPAARDRIGQEHSCSTDASRRTSRRGCGPSG